MEEKVNRSIDFKMSTPVEKFKPVDVRISDEKYRWATSLITKLKGIDRVKLVVLKKKPNSVIKRDSA